MKEALDDAGIKVHLMVQPLAYMTPDAKKQGFIDLPEFPFGTKKLFFSFSFFIYFFGGRAEYFSISSLNPFFNLKNEIILFLKKFWNGVLNAEDCDTHI